MSRTSPTLSFVLSRTSAKPNPRVMISATRQRPVVPAIDHARSLADFCAGSAQSPPSTVHASLTRPLRPRPLSPSIALPLGHLLNRMEGAESQPTGPFEGPEKLLEIWFAPSPADIPGSSGHRDGLRRVPREVWEDMLDIVKCKILSVIQGTETDAYLLRLVAAIHTRPSHQILMTIKRVFSVCFTTPPYTQNMRHNAQSAWRAPYPGDREGLCIFADRLSPLLFSESIHVPRTATWSAQRLEGGD